MEHTKTQAGWRGFSLALGLTALVLIVLFAKSCKPELVLFSSDGPLGMNSTAALSFPEAFTGYWVDIFWLGYNSGSVPPDVTHLLFWALGPVYLSKFYAPLSMLFLGVCVWFCFRRLGFAPWVCVLGALAAALNMNYFSNACWGLGSRALALGGAFLAMAALGRGNGRLLWAHCALAGLGVGLAIMEGADNGAIFSLYLAGYAFFLTVFQDGPLAKNAFKGVIRVAIIAAFAAFLAAQTLITLVGTQIQGVAGMQQDEQTTEQRWDYATQWSLSKAETLRVIIPGLFGYRTEPHPKGRDYWGKVGQQPGWETHKQGSPRHSGSGEYAGVLVVLVALWSVAQSFRRNGNAFTDFERKIIWFWSAAAIVSLLLAFGRHAPFYRIIYALPYFSTIRNPIKFMHPFHLAVLVLFGFGLQGLARLYLERAATQARSFSARLKEWWAKATSFEKKWTIGSIIASVLAILGLLVYSSARNSLAEYLGTQGFEPDQALIIARHSAGEVGLFVLFLLIAVALVTLIQADVFAGRRAGWAAALLGILLVVDLARANTPWIQYFDYKERYATNALLELLRNKPYERRITIASGGLRGIYSSEWLQHQFPYYNIHALDMPQEPRMPADKKTYLEAVGSNPTRYWQLSNTRYLLGGTGPFIDKLNQDLDPAKKRFVQRMPFGFIKSPSGEYIQVQENPAGPIALIEFTGALPRARLYSRWEVNTNDQATLQQLSRPDFDPEQTVIVADSIPAPATGDSANPGSVEITSYHPKRVTVRAKATAPSVLLLNDKFDPNWKVFVDGKADKLLRCNYIVRGVYIQPGEHTVEFRFQPPLTGLYVTLTAMAVGVLLGAFLFVSSRRVPETTSSRVPPPAEPKPATAAASPKPARKR